MKTLFLHSIRTFGMNSVQVIFGLLTSIILARTLGPEGRGDYALVVLVATTVAMVCNPSIYASANYFLSTGQWTVPQAFSTVFIASSVIGILGALISVCILPFIGAPAYMANTEFVFIALGVLTLSTTVSSSASGMFFGAKKISLITNWKIMFSALQFVLFFALSFYSDMVVPYIITFAVLSLLDAFIMMYLFSFRENISLKTNIILIKQMLSYGLPVYSSRILLALGQRIDTYILFLFTNTLLLGYYSISVTIAEQIWIFTQSVSLIMMPNIGRLSTKEASLLTAWVGRLSFTVVFIASIVLALIVPWLIPFVYGDGFTPSVTPFLILLPGTAAVGLFMIIEPFFQSRGRPKIPLAITFVGVVVNLGISVILIPNYGMMGAAFASSSAYVIQLIVVCYTFWRTTGLSVYLLLRVDLVLINGYRDIQDYITQRMKLKNPSG